MSRSPLYFLILVIIIAVGLPAVIVSRSIFFPMAAIDFIYLAGKFFGLVGFLILTFQYLWTVKIKLIEKLRSYDSRVAAHRTLGFLAILLITLHPVLILITYTNFDIPLDLSLTMGAGFLGLILLLLIAGSTFLGRIWRVRYESWKWLHWFTFPILTIVFFHSIRLGSDINGFVRPLWFVIWGIHLAILVWKFVHKVKSWSKTYRILSVKEEAPNITTLVMEKPDIQYIPGQYGFISLKFGENWESWHPFSLTSIKTEKHLSMTIKGLGDFTNRVREVKQGDTVKIDAAFGSFCSQLQPDTRYIMIAGGVGVTPIYGILKELKDLTEPPNVILFYSVHHETDILFKKDLDEWFEKIPNWKLHYICTSQPDWPGIKGRLSADKIYSLCEKDISGTFFLCGPVNMVNTIIPFLRSQGVPRRKIKREQFVFLP
jgi:predicted ferric reductase